MTDIIFGLIFGVVAVGFYVHAYRVGRRAGRKERK